MATIAVFLSLAGGSAVAARLLTGKDVKNSSLTGADVKDRSLTARDLRRGTIPSARSGPQGPAGPRGATGAQGPAGAQGDRGPDGRGVLEPLRSGETITGGFWLQGNEDAANEVEADFIPLGALTNDPITSADAFVDGAGTEPCAGTSDAPTAPAGKLCVYTTSNVNTNARQLANVITTDAARRRGFSALMTSGGSASTDEYGWVAVWAYTEP